MEQMLGPMLVVWAAGYTMRQIAQYWKQTFGISHSLHSTIGSILWSGTKNRQPADYLPTPMFEAGCSLFVIRASATRCVECFQYPTLEVFDASCSRGFSGTLYISVFPRRRQFICVKVNWPILYYIMNFFFLKKNKIYMKYFQKKIVCKFSRDFQCGYLEGIRSQLGGWTQKVKDWYWGNPFVSSFFFVFFFGYFFIFPHTHIFKFFSHSHTRTRTQDQFFEFFLDPLDV